MRCSANEPVRGKKSSDGFEHRLLRAREEPMIVAVEFNELSAIDVARHVAARLDPYCAIVAAMKHERRHRHALQQMSDIAVSEG